MYYSTGIRLKLASKAQFSSSSPYKKTIISSCLHNQLKTFSSSYNNKDNDARINKNLNILKSTLENHEKLARKPQKGWFKKFKSRLGKFRKTNPETETENHPSINYDFNETKVPFTRLEHKEPTNKMHSLEDYCKTVDNTVMLHSQKGDENKNVKGSAVYTFNRTNRRNTGNNINDSHYTKKIQRQDDQKKSIDDSRSTENFQEGSEDKGLLYNVNYSQVQDNVNKDPEITSNQFKQPQPELSISRHSTLKKPYEQPLPGGGYMLRAVNNITINKLNTIHNNNDSERKLKDTFANLTDNKYVPKNSFVVNKIKVIHTENEVDGIDKDKIKQIINELERTTKEESFSYNAKLGNTSSNEINFKNKTVPETVTQPLNVKEKPVTSVTFNNTRKYLLSTYEFEKLKNLLLDSFEKGLKEIDSNNMDVGTHKEEYKLEDKNTTYNVNQRYGNQLGELNNFVKPPLKNIVLYSNIDNVTYNTNDGLAEPVKLEDENTTYNINQRYGNQLGELNNFVKPPFKNRMLYSNIDNVTNNTKDGLAEPVKLEDENTTNNVNQRYGNQLGELNNFVKPPFKNRMLYSNNDNVTNNTNDGLAEPVKLEDENTTYHVNQRYGNQLGELNNFVKPPFKNRMLYSNIDNVTNNTNDGLAEPVKLEDENTTYHVNQRYGNQLGELNNFVKPPFKNRMLYSNIDNVTNNTNDGLAEPVKLEDENTTYHVNQRYGNQLGELNNFVKPPFKNRMLYSNIDNVTNNTNDRLAEPVAHVKIPKHNETQNKSET